jgi:hypothetical protein
LAELHDLLDQHDYDSPQIGDIRQGIILLINKQGAIIDVGLRRDALVPISDLNKLELEEREALKVNDEVFVYILNTDKPDFLVASMHLARLNQDWIRAEELLENEEIIEAEVIGYNKGGAIVPFGRLRGFVPISHLIDISPEMGDRLRQQQLDKLRGETMPLRVIEVNRRRRRLVLAQTQDQEEWNSKRLELLTSQIKEKSHQENNTFWVWEDSKEESSLDKFDSISEYDLTKIRKFMIKYFNDEELNTLAFDYFCDVYDDFTQGMSKGQKVRSLIDHCSHRNRLPSLMSALERERPKLYLNTFSGKIITPLPPTIISTERNPKQVFISHAHQDVLFAHQLAVDLIDAGWQVWIAPDSILPGEKWVDAINRGLEESGVFLVVLTPSAIESEWVKRETNTAIGLEVKQALNFIPLIFKPCDIPALWDSYQHVPFDGNYASGLAALIKGLEPET